MFWLEGKNKCSKNDVVPVAVVNKFTTMTSCCTAHYQSNMMTTVRKSMASDEGNSSRILTSSEPTGKLPCSSKSVHVVAKDPRVYHSASVSV